ncbi:MAG: filamentous hemagglutinin N-terminal domain-containing protein [Nitrospira sp.]|nr:filamentous hemagglutinin N-terminal domain-containing protein [Nitrospira sp.]
MVSLISKLLHARHRYHPQLSAALLASLLIQPFLPAIGQSQTAAPITSSGLNTTVTQSGTTFDITGGTRPGGGSNLFHSFGEFGVPTHHVANFLNDSGLATSNILSRVTGGNPSNIFGTIQTTGFGGANLFVMNPAGIVFGPNASLNVGGSVNFTTADYLRLGDGARFTATPGTQDIAISSAPVAAFGFLGSNPGAITVQGGHLGVAEGQGLSLVGGNIDIRSGLLENGSSQSARLSAPAGRINLASLSSPGEILAGTLEQASNMNGPSFGSLGAIQIAQKSTLDVSGTGNGRVAIRSGQFVLNNSTIVATMSGPGAGPPASENSGAVTLSASNIRLQNGAAILANADNGGHAGALTIQGIGGTGSAAGNVIMDNAALSATVNGGDANSTPGTITITADQVTLNNGVYITTDTFGPASAGNITFNVENLATKGGPTRLHVSPESLITNPIISETGVLIESTSRSIDTGAGNAGHITIQGVNGSGSVANKISLTDTILHTRSFGGTSASLPGGITIAANSLVLSDQVEIYTTTNGAAPAGPVSLSVNQLWSNWNPDGSFVDGRPVLIGSPTEHPASTAGPPGIVTISGPGSASADLAKLVMLSNTEIDTFAVGGSSPIPAPIIITADTVSLSNMTILVTTSGAAAPAPAGDIALNVNTLRVNVRPDGTPITSANRVFLNSPSGRLDSTAGPPGTVTISGPGPEPTDAAKLVALYNAQMSTAVEGGTAALPPGTITITADTMTMSGRTQIFAFTTSPAPAGNIALNVNTLRANVNADGTLINDGQPRSLLASVGVGEDSSSGRGGTVTISGLAPGTTDPAKLIALNNTEVSTAVRGGTEATLPASITMTADTISLTNSPNIRTDTAGAAPAGNAVFITRNLRIDQGTTISTTSSGSGPGGSVTVAATGSVILNGGSSITASSAGLGNAGSISINAGSQFLSQNGVLSTEAQRASGGNILIQAVDSIRLVNSQLSTSVKGGANTSGGNIILDPAVVTLQNSQVRAEAIQGQGGNISIIAGTFLADPTSVVSASSQFGLSGSVNIQSPVSSLSNTLATLPQHPLSTPPLLTQRCAAQAVGKLSSLVVAGRDMLPVEPGGWLMSPLSVMTTAAQDQDIRPVAGISAETWEQKDTVAEMGEGHPALQSGSRFTAWGEGCRS